MAESYSAAAGAALSVAPIPKKPWCRKPTTATANFQDYAGRVPEGLLSNSFMSRSRPSACGPKLVVASRRAQRVLLALCDPPN